MLLHFFLTISDQWLVPGRPSRQSSSLPPYCYLWQIRLRTFWLDLVCAIVDILSNVFHRFSVFFVRLHVIVHNSLIFLCSPLCSALLKFQSMMIIFILDEECTSRLHLLSVDVNIVPVLQQSRKRKSLSQKKKKDAYKQTEIANMILLCFTFPSPRLVCWWNGVLGVV